MPNRNSLEYISITYGLPTHGTIIIIIVNQNIVHRFIEFLNK
jgi:hypothetical protein